MLVPNEELLKSKNIEGNHKRLLEDAYFKLSAVLCRPSFYGEPEEVVQLIEGLEYTIQFLWGFDLDRKYHRYWKEVDGCVCPKLDNEDAIYRGVRVIDTTCNFHGNNKEQ